MQTEILQMYYPKLKGINIKRNIFGKITSTNQSEDNQNEHFIK